MRFLVTGADGFIGKALVEALERAAGARPAGAEAAQFCLTDKDGGASPCVAAGEAVRIAGDIAEPALQARLFAEPVDFVFHLAGVVSGAAEQDFALGKRVNLDATIGLLERCREQVANGGPAARFVYASSIAVFGAPLPQRIDDSTASHPTLSYGAHKCACEVLLDDYTRRGFVDARALRLAGVVVRPPIANGALSGFNSDLIREPLGGRDYVCPVGPEAGIWIASLITTIRNLRHVAGLDSGALGRDRTVTAPALAVTVAQIVEAMRRADPEAPSRIRFDPQPALEAQFGRWPRDFAFDRASALGLAVDASLDAIVRNHLHETPANP